MLSKKNKLFLKEKFSTLMFFLVMMIVGILFIIMPYFCKVIYCVKDIFLGFGCGLLPSGLSGVVIEKIKSSAVGDFMKNKLPYPLARIGHSLGYALMRKTKHFFVEDTCVGCGLCAKSCPVSAMKRNGRKPEWIQEQCVMCLSCLHHCPKFAIQYGKHTKKHGQYTHPKFPLPG